MRILLVLPASEGLRVKKSGDPVPDRKMLRFSILPLTVVAALTPPEHEVVICDENVEALNLGIDIDLVGITCMTAVANRAYKIAEAFRKRKITTVGGGFHPTLCPEDALKHFDSIVIGDAENCWQKLLLDAEAGKLRRVYQNETTCDLADVPVPRRGLMAKNTGQYATVNAVQTGRGCKHTCKYCSITAFHKATRRNRPLENVLAELRGVPRDFMFVDDNIIADPEYARALFSEMIPMKKRWVSQCSIKIADDSELLALARKSGCMGLFIGIETVSERNLASFGKHINAGSAYREQIAKIRKAGIGIIAGMIVGADDDDVSVFERTLEFLQKNRIDALQLNIMTPLPGTPLHREMESKGRIFDRNFDHYDFRHTVIRPARMSARELQDGADWLYAQFYRMDRILLRFARNIFTQGTFPALLGLKLNLTYRFDNVRDGIVGRNPAARKQESVLAAILKKLKPALTKA